MQFLLRRLGFAIFLCFAFNQAALREGRDSFPPHNPATTHLRFKYEIPNKSQYRNSSLQIILVIPCSLGFRVWPSAAHCEDLNGAWRSHPLYPKTSVVRPFKVVRSRAGPKPNLKFGHDIRNKSKHQSRLNQYKVLNASSVGIWTTGIKSSFFLFKI